jgi:tetratricopeptide (TPR) repeat protein
MRAPPAAACMRDLANLALSESLGSRFSTWLLRPYLDLGRLQAGPTHARSIDAGWQAYADPDSPSFLPQRALSPGFRVQLAEQAGAPYAVSDPRDLAKDLRTERWHKLCQDLELWPKLSSVRKCRLAALLHSMCLYEPLLKLIPEDWSSESDADPCAAQLAFFRASAKFMLDLPKRTSSYDSGTMSAFENIAIDDQCHAPVRFNATAMVFVQKAKARAPLAELDDWGKRFEIAFAAVEDGENGFTPQLFKSRFYRGMGFLPQAAGNREAMIRTMDIAERQARDLAPTTAAEEILYRENLHAVLESRTKEALWLNDLELAASRASDLTRVDPYDSKAWVELGQVHYLQGNWQRAAEAYVVAAMLGPPASSVGRYMAGVCFGKLGLEFLAAFLFKETLEIDPLGISSRQEIFDLPDIEVLDTLKQWARSNIIL